MNEDLWTEKNGPPPTMKDNKSLWQITLKALRKELCGDDGFRGQLSEYTKNPGSAPLLSGLIVSLVGIAGAHGLPLDSRDRDYYCFVCRQNRTEYLLRLYRTTSGCYLISEIKYLTPGD